MATIEDILALFSALLGKKDLIRQEEQDWWSGPADGGPNGDGRYPRTDSTGTTSLMAGPARLAASARVAITGGFYLTPESSEMVMMHVFDAGATFLNDFQGSWAKVLGDPPSSAFLITIYKAAFFGSSIDVVGYLTINPDKTWGFNTVGDEISFGPGDTIFARASVGLDAYISYVSWTMVGTFA